MCFYLTQYCLHGQAIKNVSQSHAEPRPSGEGGLPRLAAWIQVQSVRPTQEVIARLIPSRAAGITHSGRSAGYLRVAERFCWQVGLRTQLQAPVAHVVPLARLETDLRESADVLETTLFGH